MSFPASKFWGDVSILIVVTVLIAGYPALAQVRFEEGVSLVRCKTKNLATAAWGHFLPIVVRRSRQLNTQKPPVTEQNVTPAEVPP